MYAVLLLIPAAVCAIVAFYGIAEMLAAIADGITPRRAAALVAILVPPLLGAGIALWPAVAATRAWVQGALP